MVYSFFPLFRNETRAQLLGLAKSIYYQHVDGKAKSVVKQLQYLVKDPDGAYQEARKILKERFGNPAVISTNFEKKLATWPKIGPNDATGLDEFSDFLQQVKLASEHITSLKMLNFSSQIQNLVDKLPSWFKAKWSDKVLWLQRKEDRDVFPSFKDFVEEICYHAERPNIPQIVQGPGTVGVSVSERFKGPSCSPRRTRTSNVALTSAPPPDITQPKLHNEEPTENLQVLATQAELPTLVTPP